MDTIGAFYAADSAKLASMTFKYLDDVDLIAPGSLTLNDVCLSKQRDTFTLDLKLADLGLPLGDLHATFHGHDTGTTDMLGRQQLLWTVDQAVGVTIEALDGVTLDHISGHFTTAVFDVDPPVELTSCDGSDRFFNVAFETVGSDNLLEIKGHKSVVTDHYDTVHLTELALAGHTGQPLSLSVAIPAPQSGCGHPLVEGGEVRTHAEVTGAPYGAVVSYHWEIAGGEPIGASDSRTIRATISTQNPLELSVWVTVVNQTAFATIQIPVMPRFELRVFNEICALRSRMIKFATLPIPDVEQLVAARPDDDMRSSALRAIGDAARAIVHTADILDALLAERS